MKKLSKLTLGSITRGICPDVRPFPITQSPTRWFKTREHDDVMVKVMKSTLSGLRITRGLKLSERVGLRVNDDNYCISRSYGQS